MKANITLFNVFLLDHLKIPDIVLNIVIFKALGFVKFQASGGVPMPLDLENFFRTQILQYASGVRIVLNISSLAMLLD